MTLQAWADDSGSHADSSFFVLAGFVADHRQWADFANDWQALLDTGPKLEYFKMSEAAHLGGQFHKRRGWTEELRDNRVLDFTRVIAKHARVRISASIQPEDWRRYIASLPVPVRKLAVDNPYVQLADQLILATAVKGDLHGLNEACDFYFDEQSGLAEELIANWADFKWILETSSRSDLPKFIGAQPSFRDEKQFLPLQAADLYAWHVRDHLHKNRMLAVRPGTVLRELSGVPSIHRGYSTAEIQRLRDHLLSVGTQFAKNNPDIPLIGPIKNRRERRKVYRENRKARKKPSGGGRPS